MENGFGIKTALTDISSQLTRFAVDLVPRLITGLLVLLVGLLLAKIVEKIVGGVLKRVKFDALLDRIGVTSAVASLGVRGSLSASVARLIYFLIVIMFVQSAANAIGFVAISGAISSFFSYLPNLVAAIVIVLLGTMVGRFASNAVEQSTRESGVDYAPALGRAVSGGILFIVIIMAVAQLGIDTAMIRTVVVAALAGGAAAFALSFGLGTRDVTRNIVAGIYVKKLFQVGEEIEVRGERGVLSAVTPTKALLDQDGTTVAVANGQLMDEMVRQ